MRINEVDKVVTQADIDQLETFADRLFAKVGIDVEFTRHFLDRVNDERNVKQITISELTRLFKQEFKRYGKIIAQLGPDAEAVMKDLATDINMPFALRWDTENNELDLIAKTVMRKRNFKTSNKEFAVESALPKLTNGGVLGTGLDPAQFQSKYGVSPKVAQTSIGNVIKLRPGFSNPRVSNAITQYMLDTPGSLQSANDNKAPKGGKLPKWMTSVAGKLLGTLSLILTPTPAGETPEELDLLQKMQDIEKWMLYNDPQAFVDLYRAEWESLSDKEKEINEPWNPKDNANFQNAKDAAKILKRAKDLVDKRNKELLDRLTNPIAQVAPAPAQPDTPNPDDSPDLPKPANDPVPPHRRPNQPGMPRPEEKPEWWPGEVVPFPKPDVNPKSPTQPKPKKPDDKPNVPGPDDKPKRIDKPVKPGSPVDPDGVPEYDPEVPQPGKDTPPKVDPISPEQPKQPDEPDTSPDYDPKTDPKVKPSTPSRPEQPGPEDDPKYDPTPLKDPDPLIDPAPLKDPDPLSDPDFDIPDPFKRPDIKDLPGLKIPALPSILGRPGINPAPRVNPKPNPKNTKTRKDEPDFDTGTGRKKKIGWLRTFGPHAQRGTDIGEPWLRKQRANESAVLKEGGNVFKTADKALTQRIGTPQVRPTVDFIQKITGLEFVDDDLLGTTGKKVDADGSFEKNSSGDLDLNTDANKISKQQLIAKLSAWLKSQGVPVERIMNQGRKFTGGWIHDAGDQVHFRTPIQGAEGYVQTDFMFTNNPDYQRGAKRGGTDKFSGQDRAILLSSIARGRGLKFSPKFGLIDPEQQDMVIADNWNEIAEILLGKGAKESDTHTVESMLAKIKFDPDYEKLIAPWKETMEKSGKTVPE